MVGDRVAWVAGWLAAAARVTVLSGAGLSTDSGIPDYRGPQGVWTRDPKAERQATIQAWLTDRALRVDVWRRRLDSPALTAEPNAGHRALVRLEHSRRLDTIVTQNVDGLHQRAGSSPQRVVEVHGTMREAACLDCLQRWPMAAVLERVRGGDDDPHCADCGGLIKSATISFGQSLVDKDVSRAVTASRRCDLFMAVGTSLSVHPVARLPLVARGHGARLVIVNAEPTALDDVADAVLTGHTSAILPALVDAAGVDERTPPAAAPG